MLRLAWGTLGVLISVVAGAQPADPGDEHAARKHMVAVRVATPPRIDGTLEDSCWRDAPRHEDFVQLLPRTGAVPSERTTVQVCYDDRAVYVGIRAWDREPDGIVARLARRDRNVESDRVEVHLDSRHDHHTAIALFLTAAGGKLDAFVSNDGAFNFDWDAVWEGRARVDGGGWSAELAIPLAALRFADVDEHEWGIQIIRYVARRREQVVWNLYPRDRQAMVSTMAHLVGIRGIHPRRTFELRPFALVRLESEDSGRAFFAAGGGDGELSPGLAGGLDLKLGLTRGMTLDATVLPDFGQIEADEVVLNLSRFETFFPEKRPFFLEGADVFATPISLFYSRRIGRGTDPPGALDGADLVDVGGAVPILGAAKVTGAIGALGVAALVAVTAPERATYAEPVGKETVAPLEGFAVLRARRSFGGASYLGGMATAAVGLGDPARLAERDHDAFSQTLDGTWVGKEGRLRLDGQVALSERVGGEERAAPDGTLCAEGATDCQLLRRTDGTLRQPREVGVAGRVHLGYSDRHFEGGGTFSASSRRFDVDDLGFFPEYGQLKADFGVNWRDLEADDFRQNIETGIGATLVWTTDGTPYELGVGADVNVDFLAGHFLHMDVGARVPGTFDPYETGDGGRLERVPATAATLEFVTDARSRISGRLLFTGEFGFRRATYDTRIEGELRLVPLPALELTLTPKIGWAGNQTRFYAPDGGCVDELGQECSPLTSARRYRFADLGSAFFTLTTRASYTFTPDLSLTAYAQLFLARGEFDHYRTLSTMGTAPRIHLDALQPEPGFGGDTDGDGVKDDDFQEGSLNVNVVLRWEFKVGSTLQVVYAREQVGAAVLGAQGPRLELRGLGTGTARDLILLKLSLLFT